MEKSKRCSVTLLVADPCQCNSNTQYSEIIVSFEPMMLFKILEGLGCPIPVPYSLFKIIALFLTTWVGRRAKSAEEEIDQPLNMPRYAKNHGKSLFFLRFPKKHSQKLVSRYNSLCLIFFGGMANIVRIKTRRRKLWSSRRSVMKCVSQ